MTQGEPYAAYVLTDESRTGVLVRFSAKYAVVSAHHITHCYGASQNDVPAQPQKVTVTGYHDDGASQVLAVEVDGRTHQAPRAGETTARFYHITLSYDKEQGVHAFSSNALLEKIAQDQGENALRNLKDPFEIFVAPALLLEGKASPPPPAPKM